MGLTSLGRRARLVRGPLTLGLNCLCTGLDQRAWVKILARPKVYRSCVRTRISWVLSSDLVLLGQQDPMLLDLASGSEHLTLGLTCLCARSNPRVWLKILSRPKDYRSCVRTRISWVLSSDPVLLDLVAGLGVLGSGVRIQFSWVICQDPRLLDLRFFNIIILLINIIILIIYFNYS